MKGKFKFNGTGGELFSLILVQVLLTMITFGIYAAWAAVKIIKFYMKNTTLDNKVFAFNGTGGGLFVTLLVQCLLSMITFGIYAPIAYLKVAKWFVSNTDYDGKAMELDDQDACSFWVTVFVQGLLIAVTFGIYAPVAVLKIYKAVIERASWNGTKFAFEVRGGEWWCLLFVQGLLCMVTFGIYGPWAIAKIYNYLLGNLSWGDNKFKGSLDGADLFSLILIHGMLLTGLTCGIYAAWYQVKLLEYTCDHVEVG